MDRAVHSGVFSVVGLERAMGKAYDSIDDTLSAFIARQHVFFVATAPLANDGHVNVSPKGLDSFRVLGPTEVAYLDYTGSGVETIAHVRENGRIVIMFCAFDGPANILRLHGTARVVEPHEPEFEGLLENFTPQAAPRSIIVARLTRIHDSCGYGVPLYRYEAERKALVKWSDGKGTEGLSAYQQKNNAVSIDGLPGLAQPKA